MNALPWFYKRFRELYAQVKTGNPNSFPGYEKKVEANRLKTGQQDSVVTVTCRIGGVKTAVAVMDKRFLMGSMGIACLNLCIQFPETFVITNKCNSS